MIKFTNEKENVMNFDLDKVDMGMMNEARMLLKGRWPEMIEGYLEDANMYIANIKEGFTNDDKVAVASSAHPLKSSSLGMGVTSVGEIAKTLELEAKEAMENEGSIAHLEPLVPQIEEALNRASTILEATLDE